MILAVVIGCLVGQQTLGDDDYEIGESGRADSAVSDHFPDKESESVLIQSQNGTTSSEPEFRRVVEGVMTRLEGTKDVRNVENPYSGDSQGKLSEDGKSALVTFEIPYEEADENVDPSLNAVAALDESRPTTASSSSAARARTRRSAQRSRRTSSGRSSPRCRSRSSS